MPTDLDMLDFERDFLSDVLQMLGARLSTLHSHVDWDHPEESYLFDPMEHLAGVAVVAAQRYIASICNWISVDKGEALRLGPKKKGVAVASVIDAAANYWKHIEDGDGAIRTSTRRVLKQIGVMLDSSYCVSNALYECGYQNLAGLMEDLIAWRDAALEAQRKAGNIAKQSVAMNLSNQDQWLTEHIPHRFRSCLVGLPLQDELMTAIADGKTRDSIKAHCLLSAVSEGRMAAIRWLIEFVGIRDFNGKPGHPKPRRTDVSITCIQGGEPIDPSSHDAAILAKVWKGCSQASGHPTQDTNHPPVDSPALDEALRIIVDHLKRTIYSASPDKLVAKTLVPLARTNC